LSADHGEQWLAAQVALQARCQGFRQVRGAVEPQPLVVRHKLRLAEQPGRAVVSCQGSLHQLRGDTSPTLRWRHEKPSQPVPIGDRRQAQTSNDLRAAGDPALPIIGRAHA